MQMVIGLFVVFVVYAIASLLKLVALTTVLKTLIFYVPFAIIVLFSHELRRALAAFGHTPFFALFSGYHAEETISEIVLAVTSLSARRVGALIVLERREGLKTYIENGSRIDAAVSYELLVTLFAPGTPLHDGAVIVSGDRIAAAASFLPLSLKESLPKRFGTRHRAAIGITRGDRRPGDPGLGGARHDLARARGEPPGGPGRQVAARPPLPRVRAPDGRRRCRSPAFSSATSGRSSLALAIACATWYILTGQRRERISERNYRIPLSIVNVPRGTMIVSPLPDAVDVRLRGAFTPLRALDPSKLEAVVDLADAAPGEKRYPLGAEDINVPAEVEVIAISPAEIRLVLDTVAEKTVPIVAGHRRPAGIGRRARRSDASSPGPRASWVPPRPSSG